MDYTRKQLIGVLTLAIGIALVLTGRKVFRKFERILRDETHTYKPYPFPPQELLRHRAASIPTRFGFIGMEWYTYDNEVINRPPYKLNFTIRENLTGSEAYWNRPDSRLQDPEHFNFVLIEKIEIISDRGKTYSVLEEYQSPVPVNPKATPDPNYKLPLKLDRSHYYQTLSPAFDFDFDGGERIRTRVYLRFQTKSGAMEPEVLDTEWRPIAVPGHSNMLWY